MGQLEKKNIRLEKQCDAKQRELEKQKAKTAEAIEKAAIRRAAKNQQAQRARKAERAVGKLQKQCAGLKGKEGSSSASKVSRTALAPGFRQMLEEAEADTEVAMEEADALRVELARATELFDEHQRRVFDSYITYFGKRDSQKSKALWEMIGHKNEKFNNRVVELMLHLRSLNMNATQICETFSAFLNFQFPDKVEGVDYRVITPRIVRKYSRIIYHVANYIAIRAVSQCHERHDIASPQNGFKLFAVCSDGFFTGRRGEDRHQKIAVGAEIIPNGQATTEAAAAESIMKTKAAGGRAASSMARRSVGSDHAATATSDLLITGQHKHVQRIRAVATDQPVEGSADGEGEDEEQLALDAEQFSALYEAEIRLWRESTPEQRLVFEELCRKWACESHGTHLEAEAGTDKGVERMVMLRLMCDYLAARTLQRWYCFRLILAGKTSLRKRRLLSKTAHFSSLSLDVSGDRGEGYTASLSPADQGFDGGALPDPWGFCRSFSSLFAAHGDHKAYFLNENDSYVVFCREASLEPGPPLPSYKNSRQNIQVELPAFILPHVHASTRYLSEVRRGEAGGPNLLIINSWSGLSDRLTLAAVAARGLRFVLYFKAKRFFLSHLATRKSIPLLQQVSQEFVRSWACLDVPTKAGAAATARLVLPRRPQISDFPEAILAKFPLWRAAWEAYFAHERALMERMYEIANEDWLHVASFLASSSTPMIESMLRNASEDFTEVDGSERFGVDSNEVESLFGLMDHVARSNNNGGTSQYIHNGVAIARRNHMFQSQALKQIVARHRGIDSDLQPDDDPWPLTCFLSYPEEERDRIIDWGRKNGDEIAKEAAAREELAKEEKYERLKTKEYKNQTSQFNKAREFQRWSEHPVAKSEQELEGLVRRSVAEAEDQLRLKVIPAERPLSTEERQEVRDEQELSVLRDQIRVRFHAYGYAKKELPNIGSNTKEGVEGELTRLRSAMTPIIKATLKPKIPGPLPLGLRPMNALPTAAAQARDQEHIAKVVKAMEEFRSLLVDNRMTFRRINTEPQRRAGADATRRSARRPREQASARENAFAGQRFVDEDTTFEVLEVQFSEFDGQLVVTYFDVQEAEDHSVSRDELLEANGEHELIEWSSMAEVVKWIKASQQK